MHLVRNPEQLVMRCPGSPAPSIFRVVGALAQLGERLVCNQEVAGSIPVRSIWSLGFLRS
jgi:hypothetical protein